MAQRGFPREITLAQTGVTAGGRHGLPFIGYGACGALRSYESTAAATV